MQSQERRRLTASPKPHLILMHCESYPANQRTENRRTKVVMRHGRCPWGAVGKRGRLRYIGSGFGMKCATLMNEHVLYFLRGYGHLTTGPPLVESSTHGQDLRYNSRSVGRSQSRFPAALNSTWTIEAAMLPECYSLDTPGKEDKVQHQFCRATKNQLR